MSEPLLDITVADGKYRIIQDRNGTRALRYGEEWTSISGMHGSKMILAMAYEIEELREKISKLTGECPDA